MNLKNKVYRGDLELEHILKSKNISKPLEEYGLPVISGKDGKPKVKKDGTIQLSPVPAHIQLSIQQNTEGANLGAGDNIQYVVKSHKPKIVPMSIEEYKKTKGYSRDYYWSTITSPIEEILRVVEKDKIYTFYKDAWDYTERQLKRLIEKLGEDEDE